MENSIKMARESILGLRVCAVSSVSACIVISILWCKFLPPNLSFTANYFLLGSLIFFCSFCIIGDLMMYKMNVFIKSIIGAIFFLVYPISSAVLDGPYLGYLMWLICRSHFCCMCCLPHATPKLFIKNANTLCRLNIICFVFRLCCNLFLIFFYTLKLMKYVANIFTQVMQRWL